MSTRRTRWEPGTPCWADLSTADLTATTAFYTAVFGWEVTDLGEEFGHYGICSRAGLATAAIGPVMAEGQPIAWTTYLASDDAEKTAEAVTACGGSVLTGPMTIPGQGRMAIAVDPTGAAFGVWEAESMIGCQLVNEPGGVSWTDHKSADPKTARRFYAEVFGYRYTPMPGDHDYATIDGAGPGNTVGGIGAFDPGTPSDTPPGWTVYFAIEDADAACATATTSGGTVVVPPVDTPFGRMATLAGPEGGTFKVIGISAELAAQL